MEALDYDQGITINGTDLVSNLTTFLWFSPLDTINLGAHPIGVTAKLKSEGVYFNPPSLPSPSYDVASPWHPIPPPSSSFKTWVKDTLDATSVQKVDVFLALALIYRLRTSNPSMKAKEMSEYGVLTTALRIASKFHNPAKLRNTNAYFSHQYGIIAHDIEEMEREILSNIGCTVLELRSDESWPSKLRRLWFYCLLTQPLESKDPLTFGIEIEFALATLLAEDEDLEPSDGRKVVGLAGGHPDYGLEATENVHAHISSTLRKTGIRATRENWASHPDKWVVDDDETVMVPVELVQLQTCLDEIRKVVGVIDRNYRTDLNSSCGLHVHVGNGDMGFDPDTLRSLYALWTFEQQLAQIHPKHRLTNRHCLSLWHSSVLGVEQGKNGITMRKPGLEEILKCSTVNEVHALMFTGENGRRNAYDCHRLRLPFPFETHRTIEYRLAASTFDADWIEHWVRVCHGFVRYAYNADSETVQNFCRERVDQSVEEYTLMDVLEELGLRDGAEYFAPLFAANQDGLENEQELEAPDKTRFW